MSGRGGRLPYPGMRAFRRDEADLFFGREGHVDAMVDRLTATRFLAVLGPSGGGKSSLVRTGLLDALELGFSDAGAAWCIADMHPGSEPVRNLARALLGSCGCAVDSIDVDVLADRFLRGPRAVVEWVAKGNLAEGHNLLILVDQFEELFRYGDYAGREEAEAFVKILLEAAQAADVPIYVCITMRSEYLGACALIPGLAETINQGLCLTPRLTREQCKAAIEGPAGVCGFDVEPALTNKILNDMADMAPWSDGPGENHLQRLSQRADQLPLMQHVLNRMWLTKAALHKTRERLVLRRADYDALGGLKGALDAHGDEILESLGPSGRAVAARLFRALTGGTSIETAVRRPCRVSELIADQGGAREEVMAVIEAFRAPSANFLQPPHPQSISDDSLIDISHESLIRQWSTLTRWFQAEAQSAATWRELQSDTRKYREGRTDLLTGLELTQASLWWEQERPTAEWADRHGGDYDQVRAFLEASQARRDREKEAERRKGLQERKWLRIQLAASVAALIVVAALAATSLSYWQAAQAKSVQLAAQAKQLQGQRNALQVQNQTAERLKVVAQNAAIRANEQARLASQAAAAREAEARRAAQQAELAQQQRRRAEAATATARRSQQELQQQINAIGDVISRSDAAFTVSPEQLASAIAQHLPRDAIRRAADGRAPSPSIIRREVAHILSGHLNALDELSGNAVTPADRLRNHHRLFEIEQRVGNTPAAAAALLQAWDVAAEIIRDRPWSSLSSEDAMLILAVAYEAAWNLREWGKPEVASQAHAWIRDFVRSGGHEPEDPQIAADPALALALANFENLESHWLEDEIFPADQRTGRDHAERAVAYARLATEHRGRDRQVHAGYAMERLSVLSNNLANDLIGAQLGEASSAVCANSANFFAAFPDDERAIRSRISCAARLAGEEQSAVLEPLLEQVDDLISVDPRNNALRVARANIIELLLPNCGGQACERYTQAVEDDLRVLLNEPFIAGGEDGVVSFLLAANNIGGEKNFLLSRMVMKSLEDRIGRPFNQGYEDALFAALMGGREYLYSVPERLRLLRLSAQALRKRPREDDLSWHRNSHRDCSIEAAHLVAMTQFPEIDLIAARTSLGRIADRCLTHLQLFPWDISVRAQVLRAYRAVPDDLRNEFPETSEFIRRYDTSIVSLYYQVHRPGTMDPEIVSDNILDPLESKTSSVEDLFRLVDMWGNNPGPSSAIEFTNAASEFARETERPFEQVFRHALDLSMNQLGEGQGITVENVDRVYSRAVEILAAPDARLNPILKHGYDVSLSVK